MPPIRTPVKRAGRCHPYQKHFAALTRSHFFTKFLKNSEISVKLRKMLEHTLANVNKPTSELRENLNIYITRLLISCDAKYVCYTIFELLDFIDFYEKYKKISRKERYDYLGHKSVEMYNFEDYIDVNEFFLDDIIDMHFIAYMKFIEDLTSVFITDLSGEYSNYATTSNVNLLKNFLENLKYEIVYISKLFIEKENMTEDVSELFKKISL